jgi:hypothetical protein
MHQVPLRHLPQITAEESMELLAALVRERRAAVRRPARYAFAFAEGQRFVLSTDPAAKETIARGFTREAEVTILTDQRTFSELLQGRVDVATLAPHQLFVWGGDVDAMKALSQLFGGGESPLSLRSRKAGAR